MSGESSTIRFNAPAATQQAGAPAKAPSKGENVALGRGLDVGTANLLSAIQDESGEIVAKGVIPEG